MYTPSGHTRVDKCLQFIYIYIYIQGCTCCPHIGFGNCFSFPITISAINPTSILRNNRICGRFYRCGIYCVMSVPQKWYKAQDVKFRNLIHRNPKQHVQEDFIAERIYFSSNYFFTHLNDHYRRILKIDVESLFPCNKDTYFCDKLNFNGVTSLAVKVLYLKKKESEEEL